MKVLIWHVHGSWTDAFVRGGWECVLPTLPERGPWGLGRGGRDWPAGAREVHPQRLAGEDIDAVVLQRPEEVDAVRDLLGRTPGRDIPAVYVEHNTPRGNVPDTVHPMADQSAVPIVHVTHFNQVIWDSGRAPTVVIEHGVRDPGYLYTGELQRIAVVSNEPVRRRRVTGTDLLAGFAPIGPLDVFGMGGQDLGRATGLGADRLQVCGDLPREELHRRMGQRRVYLHPVRWTSLGLSLLEAMMLGMPVVALATTEVPRAVPAEAGVASADLSVLHEATRRLLRSPEEARARGRAARAYALAHYGLDTFVARWRALLDRLVDPSGSS